MSSPKADLKPPQFRTDADGKPTAVQLDTSAYVALLVRGNVIDPALWPPGMDKGAHALARIRAIEGECIAQHGSFDWEALSEATQDEYDVLCIELDSLRDPGESRPLRDFLDEPAP